MTPCVRCALSLSQDCEECEQRNVTFVNETSRLLDDPSGELGCRCRMCEGVDCVKVLGV